MRCLFIFVLILISTYLYSEQNEKTYNQYLLEIDKTKNNVKKINLYKGLIRTYFYDTLENSLKHSKKLLELSEKVNDKDSKLMALYAIGTSNFYLEYYKDADKYLTKALEFSISLEDSFYIPDILNTLGLSNNYLEEYDKSLDYYQKYIDFHFKKGDEQEISTAYLNIGGIYLELKKYSKSKYYYNKALEIYLKYDKNEEVANAYQNIGLVHSKLNEHREALKYYHKSLEIYEKLKNKEKIGISFHNIGLVYQRTKQYYKALEYYQKALIIFEEFGFKTYQAHTFYNIGEIYSSLNDNIKAIEFINKSLKISYEYSTRDIIRDGNFLLSGIHEKLGNNKKALNYYKEYSNIKDSILSKQNLEKIELLESEFQNSENQKKIELLNLEKQLKNNQLNKKRIQNIILLICLVAGVIVIIMLTIFSRSQKKITKKLYTEIDKREKSETKLMFIKQELENKVKERTKEIKEYNQKLIQEVEKHKETMLNLETTSKKAIEAEKLKSNFFSNMSHELRTPMNTLSGFSQMLSYKNLPDEKKNEYVKLIRQECKKLTNLIEEIIDYANIETGTIKINKKEFNPHPVLEYLYDYYTNELVTRDKESISFTYENENTEHDLNIFSDPERLKQVLSIFLDNAFKFTKEGYIHFGFTHSADNKIQFFVKDTGIGIDKKYRKLIFERFKQIDEGTTKEYSGAGIGLSIANSLAIILNGKIWFESVLGKGSTFYFEIKTNQKNKIEDDEFVDPENYNWENKTILLAEDKKINYELLKESLCKTKANIVWVRNGVEALEYVKLKKVVDLILMDIQMPIMDGYETTQKIKTITDKIPVIAQTAYALPLDKFKCISAGCDDYIEKPISLNKFLTILNKYLSKN